MQRSGLKQKIREGKVQPRQGVMDVRGARLSNAVVREGEKKQWEHAIVAGRLNRDEDKSKHCRRTKLGVVVLERMRCCWQIRAHYQVAGWQAH